MRTMRLEKTMTVMLLTAALFSTAAPTHAASLTDLLISKVGVSPVQAEGGAGSIFKLAKSQLTADNFIKLKKAVPAMDKYLAAAPATSTTAPASGTSEMAGAAAKALGNTGQFAGVSNKLATIQQLAPAFEALGMKSKLAGKFLPVIVDYVKSSGGAPTAKLLSGALGF